MKHARVFLRLTTEIRCSSVTWGCTWLCQSTEGNRKVWVMKTKMTRCAFVLLLKNSPKCFCFCCCCCCCPCSCVCVCVCVCSLSLSFFFFLPLLRCCLAGKLRCRAGTHNEIREGEKKKKRTLSKLHEKKLLQAKKKKEGSTA